jgi:hypothetical protein
LQNGAKNYAKSNTHDATIKHLPSKKIDAAREPDDADKDADIINSFGDDIPIIISFRQKEV